MDTQSRQMDDAASDLQIVGFTLGGGETVLCQEDDWDELRRLIMSSVVAARCAEAEHPDEPRGMRALPG